MYGLLRCRRCSLVKALLVKQCNDQAMFCSIFAFQVYPETKTEKFKTQLSLSLRFYSSNVSSHVATVELLTPKNSQSTPKWTKRWQIKGKQRMAKEKESWTKADRIQIMVLVCLQSSDGKSFEVEMEVAKKSVLIKTLLEDTLVCLSLYFFHPICLSVFSFSLNVDYLNALVCLSLFWLTIFVNFFVCPIRIWSGEPKKWRGPE